MATFWVALEQTGPWGREAALESHLDSGVGLAMSQRCADAGGRFILIRRPGQHADTHHASAAAVLVAGGLQGGQQGTPWLLTGEVDDPTELAALDIDALASGDLDAVQDSMPLLDQETSPVLLVCTNARRDVCCAVRGRPVALEVSARMPGRVWECSHTGGHRFAPTAVLLPHGQTYARLTPDLATAVLDQAASGRIPRAALGRTHDRGRSALSPPAQAAESFVRERTGIRELVVLSTTLTDANDRWEAAVGHPDGRAWQVEVTRRAVPGDLPESCGKKAIPTWDWDCALR